jgi:eukaryotic-like serine/threonine-protein kinase
VQKGTGTSRAKPPAGTKEVPVHRSSAHDFDPEGDKSEHPEEASRAVDKDPGTFWSTETYSDNQLAGANGPKSGVGIYVDARPQLVATAMGVTTEQAGWNAEVYGAAGDSAPAELSGWTKVGGAQITKKQQKLTLDTQGKPYRYYLLWITSLPQGAQKVSIGDIALYARK